MFQAQHSFQPSGPDARWQISGYLLYTVYNRVLSSFTRKQQKTRFLENLKSMIFECKQSSTLLRWSHYTNDEFPASPGGEQPYTLVYYYTGVHPKVMSVVGRDSNCGQTRTGHCHVSYREAAGSKPTSWGLLAGAGVLFLPFVPRAYATYQALEPPLQPDISPAPGRPRSWRVRTQPPPWGAGPSSKDFAARDQRSELEQTISVDSREGILSSCNRSHASSGPDPVR